MKKVLTLFLAALLWAGLAGCTAGSAAPSPTSSQRPASPSAGVEYPSQTKVGFLLPGDPAEDRFSGVADKAAQEIKATYGYSVKVETASTDEAISAAAQAMAEEGFAIIYGHGGQCAAPFAALCEQYPDTWFVTVGGDQVKDNLFPITMCAEEGAYLAGVLAGLTTESGILGVSRSADYPAINKTTNGFILGAKSVNPQVEILETVLDGPDGEAAYAAVQEQLAAGADVIFSNTNEAQPSALQAVQENGKARAFGMLGNYTEYAPEQLMGNVLCDYVEAYRQATEAIMAGTITESAPMFMTTGNGCVNFYWNDAVKAQLSTEAVQAVEDTFLAIKSGEIQVPNEFEQDRISF